MLDNITNTERYLRDMRIHRTHFKVEPISLPNGIMVEARCQKKPETGKRQKGNVLEKKKSWNDSAWD